MSTTLNLSCRCSTPSGSSTSNCSPSRPMRRCPRKPLRLWDTLRRWRGACGGRTRRRMHTSASSAVPPDSCPSGPWSFAACFAFVSGRPLLSPLDVLSALRPLVLSFLNKSLFRLARCANQDRWQRGTAASDWGLQASGCFALLSFFFAVPVPSLLPDAQGACGAGACCR